MAHWHATRTKIQLKLAIQRSRMLQEKKAALHKKVRLEIAELVERHKLESARVKTESLIMDDIHLELLELLELYCETLYARFGLLEGRDKCQLVRRSLAGTLITAWIDKRIHATSGKKKWG